MFLSRVDDRIGYDTVRLKLMHADAGGVRGYLNSVTEMAECTTGLVKYKGRLKNLWICGDTGGVSIAGSLCKFKLGNNLASLDRSTTAQAIQELSDILHLPIERARVVQLHFGNNLLMENPIAFYLPRLGYLSRHKRVEVNGETVWYKQRTSELSFYDKVAEMRARKADRGLVDSRENILRYELKLQKQAAKHLKRAEILASDLVDPTFFKQCVDKWEQEYSRINKIPLPILKVTTTGARDFTRSLASLGVDYLGGENVILGMIQGEVRSKGLSRATHHRLRTQVKKVMQARIRDPHNDSLISELDMKITETANAARSVWSWNPECGKE